MKTLLHFHFSSNIFLFFPEKMFLMTRIRTAKNIHIPQHSGIEAHKNIFVWLYVSPFYVGGSSLGLYTCVWNIDVWMCERITMCTSICTCAYFYTTWAFKAATTNDSNDVETCSPLEISEWTDAATKIKF